VFFVCHDGIEIEVLGVGSHPTGVLCRCGAVDEQFYGCNFGARGGSEAGAVDEITACGPTHAVGIGVLSTVGDDGAEISSGAARWWLRWVDELAGVCASDFRTSDAAVSEAANFVDGLDASVGLKTEEELFVFEGLAGVGIDHRVDKMVAVWVVCGVEGGMVAGWLALGGLVARLESGGLSMAAWASRMGLLAFAGFGTFVSGFWRDVDGWGWCDRRCGWSDWEAGGTRRTWLGVSEDFKTVR
jgi:hypothetical protein